MLCKQLDKEQRKISKQIINILSRISIPSNAAIVFDIDNTLIDRLGNPICPILMLFNHVKSLGIKIVLITARSGDQQVINFTMNQLKTLGIMGQILTYFIEPGKTDPWKYKYLARMNVHERGYQVIMSIGDEPWDIGDFGGIGFQVPKCHCSGVKVNYFE